MSDAVIVGFLALIGTFVGTLGGIVASNKLVTYRIQRLEEEVKYHNDFARRIPVMEQAMQLLQKQIEKLEEEK